MIPHSLLGHSEFSLSCNWLFPFQLFTNLKSKDTEVDTLKDQIEVVTPCNYTVSLLHSCCSVVTQCSWEGALCDNTENGCVADYWSSI